jgi:prefoldin subunit 5
MMAEGPKELKSLHEQTERLAASLNLAEADKVGMLARNIDEFKARIGSDIGQLCSRLDTVEKTLEEFKRAQNIKVVK